MDFGKTQRGFATGKFDDYYKQKCSIQDSSLATEPAIWLGIDNTGPHIRGPKGGPNEDIKARMHLNVPQVEELIEVLQRFVKTGSIE